MGDEQLFDVLPCEAAEPHAKQNAKLLQLCVYIGDITGHCRERELNNGQINIQRIRYFFETADDGSTALSNTGAGSCRSAISVSAG